MPCPNHLSNPCNCGPQYEPCITEPLIPVCDDPEYCEDIFTDKCIIHKGPALSNINAVDGTRLDVILTNINEKLAGVTAAELITLINTSASLRAAILAVLNP